jgi:hypothetical protein
MHYSRARGIVDRSLYPSLQCNNGGYILATISPRSDTACFDKCFVCYGNILTLDAWSRTPVYWQGTTMSCLLCNARATLVTRRRCLNAHQSNPRDHQCRPARKKDASRPRGNGYIVCTIYNESWKARPERASRSFRPKVFKRARAASIFWVAPAMQRIR